jgi:hypothetical protein
MERNPGLWFSQPLYSLAHGAADKMSEADWRPVTLSASNQSLGL